MTLKFPEKFDHPFSHVFIFGNMFPECHGFVAMPLQVVSKVNAQIFPYLINERIRMKGDIVTSTAT